MASDAPPKLSDIPQQSEFNIPTLNSNANEGTTSTSSTNGNAFTKENLQNTAQSAMENIQNHPATQSVKETVAQGPVADAVKDQHAKTTSQIQGLADKRATPNETAATGQPLTQYHSFFYSLLSWEHPRATAISFALTVLFIFATRYLPILRWTFKALYVAFGITATAEIVGKYTLSQGLASTVRPRKYYTIPRQALESSLEDVEQLINFFVIESQRILFAENPIHTVAAFVASFLSYWLIKWLPLWGLSLIFTSVIYLGPLIYLENKELIDHHLENASNVVNSQAAQVKDLAGQHTARATETVKQYAGDYSAKAQGYIGSAKARTAPDAGKATSGSEYSSSDFPQAPKQEPTIPGGSPQVSGSEPIAA